MARLLKGKPVAGAICEGLAPRIAALTAGNAIPTLAIVRVGERDDDLTGARAAVAGRSLVIGKPVAMMLQAANATVTMCQTAISSSATE